MAGLLEQAFEPTNRGYAAFKPLMQALLTMTPDNITEFTRFFGAQPLHIEQVVLWQMFFSAWAEFNPAGAIAFIDGRFQDGGTRRALYSAVMEAWDEGAIGEVLEFAAENLMAADQAGGGELALEYLRSLAESDPAAAAAMARQLSDGEFVLELVSRRIAQLAADDREAALAAIETLEGDAHSFAAGQFMMEWAKEEPAAAASWLVEHYTPELGGHAVAGVAAKYFQSDPRGAMQWIASLPEEAGAARVAVEAIENWLQADAAGAIGWLRETELPALYDGALLAAGQRAAGENPQEVIEQWVPRITEPAMSNQLLLEASTGWQRDDPGRFSEWLRTTQAIDQQTRERLLQRELPGPDSTPAPAGADPVPLDTGRSDVDA